MNTKKIITNNDKFTLQKRKTNLFFNEFLNDFNTDYRRFEDYQKTGRCKTQNFMHCMC